MLPCMHAPAQAPGCLGGQCNPALRFEEKRQHEEKITLLLRLNAPFFFSPKIAGLFLRNFKSCLQYFWGHCGDGGF